MTDMGCYPRRSRAVTKSVVTAANAAAITLTATYHTLSAATLVAPK
jgi:hypothetical protein